jgi:alpha-D-ribose 1-methylphosphonate 5-triphosphate synthase subunit PhnH
VSKLRRGTLEHPERGATAIYAVEELSNVGTVSLKLTGPGVSGSRTLGLEGLAATEAAAIREIRQDYPLGVDVYLVDGAGRVAGLPRSTRLEVSA